jgi:hypothetical protein
LNPAGVPCLGSSLEYSREPDVWAGPADPTRVSAIVMVYVTKTVQYLCKTMVEESRLHSRTISWTRGAEKDAVGKLDFVVFGHIGDIEPFLEETLNGAGGLANQDFLDAEVVDPASRLSIPHR